MAAKKQYTIRNVPDSLDRALRKKASQSQKSMNAALLEALAQSVGLSDHPKTHHDLDQWIGSWIVDPETEKALNEQRSIDPKDWA